MDWGSSNVLVALEVPVHNTQSTSLQTFLRMFFMGSVFGSIFDKFGAQVGLQLYYLVTTGLTVKNSAATDYRRGYRLFSRVYVAKHMVSVNMSSHLEISD